jgi:hypothetical protein
MSSSAVKVDGHHLNFSPLLSNALVWRMIHVASDSYHSVGTVVVLTLSGELRVFKIVPHNRTSFM